MINIMNMANATCENTNNPNNIFIQKYCTDNNMRGFGSIQLFTPKIFACSEYAPSTLYFLNYFRTNDSIQHVMSSPKIPTPFMSLIHDVSAHVDSQIAQLVSLTFAANIEKRKPSPIESYVWSVLRHWHSLRGVPIRPKPIRPKRITQSVLEKK